MVVKLFLFNFSLHPSKHASSLLFERIFSGNQHLDFWRQFWISLQRSRSDKINSWLIDCHKWVINNESFTVGMNLLSRKRVIQNQKAKRKYHNQEEWREKLQQQCNKFQLQTANMSKFWIFRRFRISCDGRKKWWP